jgi:TPR repeat protein
MMGFCRYSRADRPYKHMTLARQMETKMVRLSLVGAEHTVNRGGPGENVLMRLIACCTLCFFAAIPAARAANDTSRFYGTWTASLRVAGREVTILSRHDADGYRNFVVTPNGNQPAGDGKFFAANGRYSTSAPFPNEAGTYHFLDPDTVACTNAAGQMLTWKRARESAVAPPASRPRLVPAPAPTPAPAPAPAATAYDPSLPPETNAAIAAFNRKDYNSAWTHFMAAAQAGDPEAEAGVGAMLLSRLNPPGTGYPSQCEKWLLASANQGNMKGMTYLAQFYYARAVAIAGPIDPDLPVAQRSNIHNPEVTAYYVKARTWLQRAADRGDIYAMGKLAEMLDAGLGGPKNTVWAAQLRARVKAGPDKWFAGQITAHPQEQAMIALWQAGRYVDAVQAAQPLARRGDARAQALLARAYFEGSGADRNAASALTWAQKAAAQNDPDGLYYLGMIYYTGWGVPPDWKTARALFTRSAKLGKTLAGERLSDIYYQTCKPQPSYWPNGDYKDSQCPSVDVLSNSW